MKRLTVAASVRKLFAQGRAKFDYTGRSGFSNSLALFPAVGLVALCSLGSDARCEESSTDIPKEWPVYRKADLAKHDNATAGYWVSFKDGVYDISKFIVNHPGGADKIKLAAGKAVEPFWQLYRQHYNSSAPLEILATLRIGTLHPDDVAANEKARDDSDPFKDDPELSPVMKLLQQTPLCAEPPDTLIGSNYITPNPLFFVRNHHPVPVIDANKFVLTVCNNTSCSENSSCVSSKRYSLQELKTKFKKHTVVATLECGGNRRSLMNSVHKTAGLAWSNDAISNAKWSGVRLADIIADATASFAAGGLTIDTLERYYAEHSEAEDISSENPMFPKHVQFESVDGLRASIPIRKALDYCKSLVADCILHCFSYYCVILLNFWFSR